MSLSKFFFTVVFAHDDFLKESVFLFYFPVLLNIADKKILLVGAGEVAAFKFNKICEYNPLLLKVVSLAFSPKIRSGETSFCQLIQKKFEMSDLDGMDIVIVGVNDLVLQQEIYDECNRRKILCNCVDEINRCDFIFSSTIKRGDIVISVSSSGKAPGFSVAIKDYIESLLPANLEEKLKEVMELRKSLPVGKERMALIRSVSAAYFKEFIGATRK